MFRGFQQPFVSHLFLVVSFLETSLVVVLRLLNPCTRTCPSRRFSKLLFVTAGLVV